MTPEFLTRLRSWLSADESQYECRLSVNEVREIVGALEAKDADIRLAIKEIVAWRNAFPDYVLYGESIIRTEAST